MRYTNIAIFVSLKIYTLEVHIARKSCETFSLNLHDLNFTENEERGRIACARIKISFEFEVFIFLLILA